MKFDQLKARLAAAAAPNDREVTRVYRDLANGVWEGTPCTVRATDLDAHEGRRTMRAVGMMLLLRTTGLPHSPADVVDYDALGERIEREFRVEWSDDAIAHAIELGRQVRAALASAEAITP